MIQIIKKGKKIMFTQNEFGLKNQYRIKDMQIEIRIIDNNNFPVTQWKNVSILSMIYASYRYVKFYLFYK